MRVSVLLCSLLTVLAACVDVDDDRDDDDDEEALPYTTTAPPGGPCGRDWNTFDPRRTYVVAVMGDSACKLFDPFDPEPFAARLPCAGPDFEGAISTTTGELLYASLYAGQVYRFAADLPPTTSTPCSTLSNQWTFNDDEIVGLRDSSRLLFDHRDRRLNGNDDDGWQVASNRLVRGYVVAFNVDGDALVAINSTMPSPWRIERADGSQQGVALPPNICTTCAGRSAKRDGRGFRLIGVRGDEVVGWHVDANGDTSTFATYPRCADCRFDDIALLDDDSILVGAADDNEVLQLKPDGSITTLVPAGSHFGIVRFVSGT